MRVPEMLVDKGLGRRHSLILLSKCPRKDEGEDA